MCGWICTATTSYLSFWHVATGRNGASSVAIFSSDTSKAKTTAATYYPELSPTRHATHATRGRRATSLLASSGSPAHRPFPASNVGSPRVPHRHARRHVTGLLTVPTHPPRV
jgi:hypothetical protein